MRKSKCVKSRASSAKTICGRNGAETLKSGLRREMNTECCGSATKPRWEATVGTSRGSFTQEVRPQRTVIEE